MVEARALPRRTNPRLWLAGGWLLVILLAAIFAPLVAPHDPLAQDLMLERLPPFWVTGAEPGYWLGTDSLGRDLLSRLIYGGRIAFAVAFAAAIAACVTGSALGLVAGYFGGWADRIVSRIVDIWMAFPPVLFAILLVAVLGTGLSSVIIAIAVIDWTRFCRVVRSEVLVVARKDFVAAARLLGFSDIRIILREILPSVAPLIITLFTLQVGIGIIVEAILSFVGLSVPADVPAWGKMIAGARNYMYQAPWGIIMPILAMFVTVLGFNLLGEGLRVSLDPRLRRRSI